MILVGGFFVLVLIAAPALGSDTEFMLQERTMIETPMDCGSVDECEEPHGHSLLKICGTNGKTFSSFCAFQRAYCKERNVQFKKYGECSASEKCLGERNAALIDAKLQTGVFIPVCKADGTYMAVQCHNNTGYCWCMTPTGEVVRGTVRQNAIPDCKNVANWTPNDTPVKRPLSGYKGIAQGTDLFIVNPAITNYPTRPNRESVSLIALHGVPGLEISTPEHPRKKPKRPRGCEGSRRKQFNKNMLNSMIQEYRREHKNSVISSDKAMESAALHWRFDELNTRRKDNLLQKNEYKGIQKIIRGNFKPRKCAKKFPKFCDANGDKTISLEEWIKCFTTKDSLTMIFVKEKPKKNKQDNKIVLGKGPVSRPRPCEYDKKQVLDNGDPNAYVPKCDRHGEYQPVQCYGSNTTTDSWYCFCVNAETGDMIENTSMRYGTPNCSVTWPKCPPPDKEKTFLLALRNYLFRYVKQRVFKKNEPKSSSLTEENVIEKFFKYIDKNGNNYIEGKEKRSLKKSISKKDKNVWRCGRKIHIVCDSNTDGKISLQELHSCLSPSRETGHNYTNESFVKKPAKSEFPRGKGKTNPFIDIIKPE